VSRENVELVQRGFEAWERGDLESLVQTFDEDVVTRPIIGPDRLGPQGVLEMAADWVEGLDEFTMKPEEFMDAGDQVVVRVRQEAREASAGLPVEATFWFVYTIREGKAVRFELFRDREQALEAAGVRE